ncbi:MAG: hypothetical protein ACFE9I_11725 [Candidatus Hermodarchaeota archaeon]
MKNSQLKRILIVIKVVIIALTILIFIPMTSSGIYMIVITYDRPYTVDLTRFFTAWPAMIILIIGICLNFFSIKDKESFRFISDIGLGLTVTSFLLSYIMSSVFYYTADITNRTFIYNINFYLVIAIMGIMIFERFLTMYDRKKEIFDSEVVSKSKGLFKKGLKKLGKMAGDMVGDMVEDKLAEVTRDSGLADMVGDLADKGVTKLTQAGLSKLAEKGISPPKTKGLLKKGLKGVTKKVGKIAGDMVGDAISDLTGKTDFGEMVGKYAEKGVSKLTETALGTKPTSIPQPNTTYVTPEPIKIDYKKRILGIIKTKKQVKIEYIESILKLNRIEIIGMIYELIGKGKIEGEFNSDDTEFTLK